MTRPREPDAVVSERGQAAITALSAPGEVTAAEALALAILTGELPIAEDRDP